MTRRPLIGTSWKMNLGSTEADRWFAAAVPLVAGIEPCDLFVLPPFTSIWVARQRLAGTRLAWGAQDVHPAEEGAHTGDISASMLVDLGCTYVELGHSERRRDHAETDALIAAKVARVMGHGMTPILCVGEPEPGSTGAAVEHVGRQLDGALAAIEHPSWPAVVVAYEPVWAIGVGARAADPAHVGAVQRSIHERIRTVSGGTDGRVIYGGSVDESTAAAILAQDGVDGLFVGRAALDPARFAAIAAIAAAGAGGSDVEK